MIKVNYLAFLIGDDLGQESLVNINVVDDIEEHSKLADKMSAGNLSFKYVPVVQAYHADELVTRLYNLVNVLDTVLPDKDEEAHGILEAVVFSRNEARETLKKLIP